MQATTDPGVSNLVAVASMIAYFWRRHSDLPGRLLRG
jgi:hypothetical protein